MNKSLKDIEPKGRLNPAGPGSYELPGWTAFNRRERNNNELKENDL